MLNLSFAIYASRESMYRAGRAQPSIVIARLRRPGYSCLQRQELGKRFSLAITVQSLARPG